MRTESHWRLLILICLHFSFLYNIYIICNICTKALAALLLTAKVLTRLPGLRRARSFHFARRPIHVIEIQLMKWEKYSWWNERNTVDEFRCSDETCNFLLFQSSVIWSLPTNLKYSHWFFHWLSYWLKHEWGGECWCFGLRARKCYSESSALSPPSPKAGDAASAFWAPRRPPSPPNPRPALTPLSTSEPKHPGFISTFKVELILSNALSTSEQKHPLNFWVGAYPKNLTPVNILLILQTYDLTSRLQTYPD